MAYYSKYTGAELEERLDKVEEIPQLIAQMITGKDFVTKEDLLCVLKDYAPADYRTIPIDNNTIYWENGVLKAATSGGGGQCQWELREHKGIQYLFSRLPVVTQYDVTMYADVNHLDLPSIYDGLPIDGDTIYWEETENGRILKSKYEGSSGVDASEVLSIVSSAGYATQNWVNNQNFISSSFLYTELAKYVKIKDYQEIEGVKNFLNGLQIAGLPITKLNGYEDVIYIDANVVVRGGLTMYYEDGEINLPSIKEEIGNAGYDGVTGLASFNSSQFYISSDGTVTIIGGSAGLDTAQLAEYLTTNKYATQGWITEQNYASASNLTALQSKVDNFLEGSDSDTIINKWLELEAFLSGLSESDNLATILSNKANKATTLAGYGITDAYTKTQLDNTFKLYIPIAGYTEITGEKNFTGGLRVNNSPVIYYDEDNKYWKLEGDLLVTGGVSMYSDDTDFIPSTIMDAVVVDGVTIKKRSEDGALYFAGTMDGGVTDFWELNNIPTWIGSSKPTYTLGSLQNVDSSSIDATATVDRVLFQQAGSATWSWKALSEIGGGSSGSVSGAVRYLSTLGSAGSWYDNTYRLYGEWGLHDRLHLKTEGGYDVVSNIAEKDGNGNVITSTYLPLSGGTINGTNPYPLVINTTETKSGIQFLSNNDLLGVIINGGEYGTALINFKGKYRALGIDNDGNAYTTIDYNNTKGILLHSANYSSYALPLSGGILTGNLTLGNSSNTSHIGYYINRSGNTIGLAPDYNCACLRFATSTSKTNYLRLANGVLDLSYDGGTNWNNILHAGNISSYNAGSATKLQTARTIWGQSFDGTGNVSGDIYLNNSNSIRVADTSGTSRKILTLDDGNNVVLGYHTADASYDTYIDGLNIHIRSGKHNEVIHINSNGKVGIGTTSPTQPLHVVGNIAAYIPSTNDATASIDFANTINDRWQISGRFNKNKATENDRLNTYYYNGSTWEAIMTLQTNGNVGIGTTSPATKLEVNGGFGVTGYTWLQQLGEGYTLGSSRNSAYLPSGTVMYVGSLDNNVSSASLINFDTKAINKGTNGVFIGGVDSGLSNGASNFVIGRRTGTSTWAESLRIDANGNVGIGTTSPAEKLDINGHMIIRGAGDNLASINLYNSSTSLWQISARFTSSDKNLKLYYYNGSTYNTYLTISQSGGNMLVAGGITMYSDIRKKTKLKDVELSLSQIADAPLIQHYYNSDQEKTTHVGSIAQYWAGLNDWFCKLDNEGYYTMEIQNCALASAISIARHLEKYETKTDKTIRKMKQRIQELEDKLEKLEGGNYVS